MARKMSVCCGEGRFGSNLERKRRTQKQKFPWCPFWAAGGRWQGPGSRGLQGWPLTRDKELPNVRHSQLHPAPMDLSLAKTEHISSTGDASVVTYLRKGFLGGCFTNASASSNCFANLSSSPLLLPV